MSLDLNKLERKCLTISFECEILYIVSNGELRKMNAISLFEPTAEKRGGC